jgi:hypothetical protein
MACGQTARPANIYAMTLGGQIGLGMCDRLAMLHEVGGILRASTFAEVDRTEWGLAACLRFLGYGSGDRIWLHTG